MYRARCDLMERRVIELIFDRRAFERDERTLCAVLGIFSPQNAFDREKLMPAYIVYKLTYFAPVAAAACNCLSEGVQCRLLASCGQIILINRNCKVYAAAAVARPNCPSAASAPVYMNHQAAAIPGRQSITQHARMPTSAPWRISIKSIYR